MDLEAQWSHAANVAVTVVTTYGLRVIGAIIILVVGWIASRLLYRAVVRVCERSPHIDRTVVLFLGNGVRYTALVITFVAVLTTFGIATTSFVAVLGALSNLAAGIMLVLFRPFHVGDRIETGGVSGTTRVIDLFYTEIDSDDKARIVIPNGKLWGEIVRVPSQGDTARIDLRYPRPANDDVSAAIARLKELIQRDKRVLGVAAIGVESIGDGTYTLAAQALVSRSEEVAVRLDLNRTVKEEFERRAPKAPTAVERRAG